MPGLPIGPLELVLILGIALLILGPGKLPEVGSALGRTIREFRKASTEIQDATSLTEPRPAVRAPVPGGASDATTAAAGSGADADVRSDPRGTPASPVRDDA
jgi:sec-independent protein translocase protein TatA